MMRKTVVSIVHVFLPLICCHSASAANHTVHLVVANYKESMSWINKTSFPRERIFVYQKHSPDQPRHLPNKGNECLAYVKHIVDHYQSLPDYLICLHDKPVKHCPNYLEYLDNAPIYESKADFENNKPSELMFITEMYRNNSKEIIQTYIPETFSYYKKWLGKEMPAWGTSIWCNGQFQVSKRLILMRPFSFWKELQDELLKSGPGISYGDSHGIYICGYLEQVWNQLFGRSEVTPIISTAYVNGREGAMCNRNPKDPIH